MFKFSTDGSPSRIQVTERARYLAIVTVILGSQNPMAQQLHTKQFVLLLFHVKWLCLPYCYPEPQNIRHSLLQSPTGF